MVSASCSFDLTTKAQRHKEKKEFRDYAIFPLGGKDLLTVGCDVPEMMVNDGDNKTDNSTINKKKALCLSAFVVAFSHLRQNARGVLCTTKTQRHKERKEFWDCQDFPLHTRGLLNVGCDGREMICTTRQTTLQ
jgi:hypothetical protein